MTTINLSEIEDAKIQALAVKATLKGVLVDYLGPHTVKTTPGDKVFHPFVVTSVSDPSRFHDVLIWKEQGKWMAECDAEGEDGCEANRKGGKLCSHLAIAFTELKKELGKQEYQDALKVENDRTTRGMSMLRIYDEFASIGMEQVEVLNKRTPGVEIHSMPMGPNYFYGYTKSEEVEVEVKEGEQDVGNE